jgi:tetratricopeptide (TPR) repeat protein
VNLLPLSAPLLAERFGYLPSVGFCLLAGGGLARVLGPAQGALRAHLRPVPAVALLVPLCAYTGLTLWRNEDWRDEERLFSRMLDTSPGVALPLVNLALVEMRQGRILEAHGRLEAAVELAPGHPKALAGLALTETLLGRPERGLALALRAREAAPQDPNILATVGSVHLYRLEPEVALGYLQESLRLNPHQVHSALNRALALAKLGRWPEAEEALDRARPLVEAMSPGLPLAQRVAAEVYGGRDPARARAAWERYIAALSAQPDRGPALEADLRYARRELARLPVTR